MENLLRIVVDQEIQSEEATKTNSPTALSYRSTSAAACSRGIIELIITLTSVFPRRVPRPSTHTDRDESHVHLKYN